MNYSQQEESFIGQKFKKASSKLLISERWYNGVFSTAVLEHCQLAYLHLELTVLK